MAGRGATRKGRARSRRLASAGRAARPLVRLRDHGPAVPVRGKTLGLAGDRWVEPFLQANRAHLRRLEVRAEVAADPEPHVRLYAGSRVGAVPLLHPSTRKIAAGLLVQPRFRWSAVGAVFGSIGFAVEPSLGGAPLVPGSAREVPSWMLAAPVLRRLAGLLRHRRRDFVQRTEERARPRGRVDWHRWATVHVPRGRWTRFDCTFPDPDDDPDLLASVRWTLQRLRDELASVATSPAGRRLLSEVGDLMALVGDVAPRRPRGDRNLRATDAWLADAWQAMTWVADERGLGGARTLDGLAWDLPIDAVWEAWVVAFMERLGTRLGYTVAPFETTRRRLPWRGDFSSMGSLAPDTVLTAPNRAVWVDAKYKPHLALLARRGWSNLPDRVRDAHRADLHQALAYAALADVDRVDTVLVYPSPAHDTWSHPPTAVADLATGRRRVRLHLAALPFGFTGPEAQARAAAHWQALLAA